MTDNRLIVALDFHEMDKVATLVERLGDSVGYYKVGMELFYSVGESAVKFLREKQKNVFLDLKLHDIPNTTAQGICSLTRLGASMLNVHASGGLMMMKTAAIQMRRQAAEHGSKPPKLIAVTVLTSVGEADWRRLNFKTTIGECVVQLAKLAQEAGLDGVVASPKEAAAIRRACGDDFLIVTPGVRPAGAAADDQSRFATPSAALRSGASHLVVGRPITQAGDPKEAAERILAEMEAGK